MRNTKTKNSLGFIAMVAVLLLVGCKPQTKEEPAVQAADKEVIVVPAAPVVIEKAAPEKSTSVTLDSNGVKVETKKLDVKVQ